MKTFETLFDELSRKAAERPEGSGTVAQLDAGTHAIGKKIVEDVKSAATKKNKEYVIKRKLLLWRHGIRIKEI